MWIIKDKKLRNCFNKFEIKKLVLKSLLYNKLLSFDYKIYFDNIFKKFPYNSSISKYRTSCLFLGNSRSIFRRFKLSRHSIKKYAPNGYITGLKKSSF